MREEYRRWLIMVFAMFCALVASASASEAEVLVVEKSIHTEEIDKEVAPDAVIETEVAGVIEFVPPAISTLDGIQVASWSPNVTISLATGVFRYESDGIPDHELPDPFDSAEPSDEDLSDIPEFSLVDIRASLDESPIDETITLHPVLADAPTPLPNGLIGVLINGAQLYNESGLTATSSLGAEASEPIGFVDSCNGQPVSNADPAAGSVYHYHAVPRCTTDAIDLEAQHSSILGILIDGFPVYGSNDAGGERIRRRDLDQCSGHFGPTPEFPDGIYHYHLVEQVRAVPIPCLSGEFDESGRVPGNEVGAAADPRDSNDVGAAPRDEVGQLGAGGEE